MCLPTSIKGASIQSIATAIGNLLCFNFGLMFGITPAHMRIYQQPELTPLNAVTDRHGATWLMGYLFITAALGAVWSGWLARKIGPKSVLLLCGVLQIIAWFTIHFSFALIHIYASRMFGGFAAGAAFVVLPIFINEIAETRAKATGLTFTIDIWRAVGILLGLLMGYFVPYDYVSIVGCCVSFAFSMCFPFIQESPYYYCRRGNEASLEKSLRWYRGIRSIDDRDKPEYLSELAVFKQSMQGKQSIGVTPMPRAYVWRLFLISLLLAVGGQVPGVYILITYAGQFLASRNELLVQRTILILAGVQLLAALLARCLGPRIPRKLLLCVSSLVAAVAAIALIFYRQQGANWHLEPMLAAHMPLLLLALFVFFVHVGLSPLSFVINSELLPEKLHNNIFSFVTSIAWTLIFVLIVCFNLVENLFGISILLWCFAGICIALPILMLVLLPETRGRSSDHVQQELGYVSFGGVAKITEASNGYISNI